MVDTPWHSRYDLARSIVLTRQGNPAWAGQERDGIAPIRSDDLFFGGTQPDWVDLNRVAIPQADEQQRLLANVIGHINAERRAAARFWYFPRGEKAVVVMTGDDHANNGTAGRFEVYKSNSPAGCTVDNWECVRATSYIFPNTPISNAQVSAYRVTRVRGRCAPAHERPKSGTDGVQQLHAWLDQHRLFEPARAVQYNFPGGGSCTN